MVSDVTKKQLEAIKPDELARLDFGVAFNFAKQVPGSREAQDLALRLCRVYEQLPNSVRQTVDTLVVQLVNGCEQIASIPPQNAPNIHQNLKNALAQVLDGLRNLRPHLLALEGSAEATADQTRRLGELMDVIQRQEAQAQNAATSARQAAGITAAANWVRNYETRARRLQIQSILWYLISIFWALSAIALAGAYLWFLQKYHPQEPLPDQKFLTSGIPNFGTSIVFIGALAIAGWLYHGAALFARSYRHLAEMARHRASVGRTYEAFYANADDKTKPAVLLAVLTALITPDRTGFIKREADTTDETLIESAVRYLGKGP